MGEIMQLLVNDVGRFVVRERDGGGFDVIDPGAATTGCTNALQACVRLAFAAFEIQMRRRGWACVPENNGKFCIRTVEGRSFADVTTDPVITDDTPTDYDDPLTAWVETEKWFVVNMES